jgi:hypothetical protein
MRAWIAGLALAVALIVGPRPAAAVPLPIVIERARITVRAESGLESVARRLANASGDHLAEIALDLPDLETPRDVEILVVDDAADMNSVAPGGRRVPTWAAGVAFPDLGIVIVAMRRQGRPLDIDEVLHHELAHLALGAALGPSVPRWLHEGFAYQHSAEWSWDRTETLAGMAWGGGVIPLDELERGFPAEELPASRAYAESYDFVGFLARRGRWEDASDDGDRFPFRRFLTLIARGEDPDLAASHAYGRPLKALFDEWREDLSRRYLLLPAGVFAALIWIVASILLVLAFLRRRRQNRRRLADWERQDAIADARRTAWLDSLATAEDQLDDDDRPPHTVN